MRAGLCGTTNRSVVLSVTDAGFRTVGHVRFGSKADICTAIGHVRFTPNSDRERRHTQTVMSALHPKANMCGARGHVRFGPIADIARLASCELSSGVSPSLRSQLAFRA